jgi:ketosteroid isomerase-like protein
MPATEPEQIHRLFEQAFNADDLDGLMALYEPEAVLVPQPGAVVEGSAAVGESLRWFLDRKGRITLDTKLVLRVGDLAYMSNRWSLTGGTMPDGSPAELGATTAEVARRQPDGSWLYVIDNAWGDLAIVA